MEADPVGEVQVCKKCGCRMCAHNYLYLCRTYGNASLCSHCREGELYLEGKTSELERIRSCDRRNRVPRKIEMFPDCWAWAEALERDRESEGSQEKGGPPCS